MKFSFGWTEALHVTWFYSVCQRSCNPQPELCALWNLSNTFVLHQGWVFEVCPWCRVHGRLNVPYHTTCVPKSWFEFHLSACDSQHLASTLGVIKTTYWQHLAMKSQTRWNLTLLYSCQHGLNCSPSSLQWTLTVLAYLYNSNTPIPTPS